MRSRDSSLEKISFSCRFHLVHICRFRGSSEALACSAQIKPIRNRDRSGLFLFRADITPRATRLIIMISKTLFAPSCLLARVIVARRPQNPTAAPSSRSRREKTLIDCKVQLERSARKINAQQFLRTSLFSLFKLESQLIVALCGVCSVPGQRVAITRCCSPIRAAEPSLMSGLAPLCGHCVRWGVGGGLISPSWIALPGSQISSVWDALLKVGPWRPGFGPNQCCSSTSCWLFITAVATGDKSASNTHFSKHTYTI